MRAVIERNKNAELCARVKQPAFFRVFAYRVNIRAVRNASYNCTPALPQIGRFENVWLEVVEFMAIHCDVRSIAVMGRWIDEIDSAPLRHFRRDLRPMLSVIGCDVEQSIICSSPERSFFHH